MNPHLYPQPGARWRPILKLLPLMLLCAFIIGASCVGGGGIIVDGNLGLDPNLFPSYRIQGEPNDNFNQSLDVIFDQTGRADLQGQIDNLDDIDVFSLGELSAGDRIIIDVGTPGNSMDPAIAVFDIEARLAFENDDRNYELRQYDPFINQVVRRDSEIYYLAIFKAPLDTTDVLGTYEIQVTRVLGGQVPQTYAQTVVLDCDGGSISIPGLDTFVADPFDTGDIDPAYIGMTEATKQQIEKTVLENFEGLALNVHMTPDDALPQSEPYSTVLFGGENPGTFGLSENIDAFNADPSDEAIVFTSMFTPRRFGRELTAEELGLAIGNIASHELGHLLGLNHVADVYDVMDTVGAPNTFLFDQEFKTSQLDETISPLGLQDSFLLLLETLGQG